MSSRARGEPSAYILSEEGSAAFFGGLRYGEGGIYYKHGITQHIYWQGITIAKKCVYASKWPPPGLCCRRSSNSL